MLWRLPRRVVRRQWFRGSVILVAFLTLIDVVCLVRNHETFERNLRASHVDSPSSLPALVRRDKIFICAQFWTSAVVLATYWNDALIDLVTTLGPENVYVSILESGSLDNSKDFLRDLDAKLDALGVQKTIITENTTHQDEITRVSDMKDGWLQTPGRPDQRELRRIPYLARLRNRAMRPLHDASVNMKFDKVLFLNDVVFLSGDVLTLLATRDGRYTVACALDFNEWDPSLYYDTFALRDAEGAPTITRSFPYFRSPVSRNSLLQGLPVKVQSCWNGMIVMDASSFYTKVEEQDAVSFRAIPDSLAGKHLEGSECCLIHADLAQQGLIDLGIWVNPAVRVGYKQEAYQGVHFGDGHGFVSPKEYVAGVWGNRLRRWTHAGESTSRTVNRRLREWKSEGTAIGEERRELGEMCLIDETHVLIWNGWKHM